MGLPAARSCRSYTTSAVVNPIQARRPGKNRWRSGSWENASRAGPPRSPNVPVLDSIGMSVSLPKSAWNRSKPALRRPVSWRERRTARTTSAPERQAATSSGITSGGSCRSASMVTTASAPLAWARPAERALWKPKLRESSTSSKRGSRRDWARIMSADLSRLPSFTKIVRHAQSACARKSASRRAMSSGRTDSSLNTGMTMATVGLVSVMVAAGGSPASGGRAGAPCLRMAASSASMIAGFTGRMSEK